jgi:hypothetical protein
MSLGILGLNEDFVQVNEVMSLLISNLEKISKIIFTIK